MIRRSTEVRLAYHLRRRAAGFLPDMPDYTTRLSRRTKEWRLSRLLSGWPALLEDDDAAATPPALVEEPVALLAYRRAA